MRFRGFKKFISVTLAVMMIVSTLICGSVITEAATYSVGDEITYQFIVNTGEMIQAFEGEVHFPSEKLSVVPQIVNRVEREALVADGFGSIACHAEGDVLYFQASSDAEIYDYTTDAPIISVKFSVIDDAFSPTEIFTELSSIYNKEHNDNNTNNPYSYKNVINDKVISGGVVDIDQGTSEETTGATEVTEDTTESTNPTVESTNPTTESTNPTVEPTNPTTESTNPTVEPTEPTTKPVETIYTVKFNYVTEDGQQTITKTVSITETDIQTIVNNEMPNIENKMYYYSLGSWIEDGTTITANLVEKAQKYTVTVDDEEVRTDCHYKEKVTVTLENGSPYTFYVTDDTVINSEDIGIKGDITISRDAVTVSDAGVSIDLLATANIEKFARMGVAFATSEKTVDEITTAVTNVTTDTSVSNGIAVHNSAVDKPNESGSYQFVYAPFLDKDKVSDKTLYFYTFAVDTQGIVTVSSFEQVDLANAYA